MRKFFKTLIIIVLGAVLLYLAKKSQKSYAEDELKMPKTDDELIGERFEIPRDGKDSVSANLYLPEGAGNVPAVFNIHGGAFIGGHADTLDAQSQRLSENWNAAVITINYTLTKDGISIEYGTEAIMDTVKYFKEHAGEYRMDSERFVLMGYSAGAYHALMAALKLKKEGVDIAAQVLCYPYIRMLKIGK